MYWSPARQGYAAGVGVGVPGGGYGLNVGVGVPGGGYGLNVGVGVPGGGYGLNVGVAVRHFFGRCPLGTQPAVGGGVVLPLLVLD